MQQAKRWLVIGGLGCVLALGWYVRFEDFSQWGQLPQVFYAAGQPVLTNSDGYFYLRLARDLAEGQYGQVDVLRRVPDPPDRPWPPPLLACGAALLHGLSGVSLERLAVLLPTFLGPLVALPVYGLARALGGGLGMGLVAALLSVLGGELVARSRVGFFDTDGLNAFFVLAAAYWALRCAVAQGRGRWLAFAAWAVNAVLFWWWWDQAPQSVALICTAPMAWGLGRYVKGRQGRYLWGATAVYVLGVIGSTEDPLGRLRRVWRLGGQGRDGLFPQVDIAELVPLGWEGWSAATLGQPLLLAGALAGLALLAWQRRGPMVFLLVPVFMGLMPLFFGVRFAIFSVAVLALGYGYGAEVVARRVAVYMGDRRGAYTAAVALLGLGAALPGYRQAVAGLSGPVTIQSAPAMAALAHTEPNAAVWTSWTAGYLTAYRARRATFLDGQFMDGQRRLYASWPLARRDLRLAANFMRFYHHRGLAGMQRLSAAFDGDAARGMECVRQVLQAGPQEGARVLEALGWPVGEWLDFFYPQADGPPLYLLLHREYLTNTRWYYYGAWDLAARRGTYVVAQPYQGVTQRDGFIYLDSRTRFDKNKGKRFEIASDEIPAFVGALGHLYEHLGDRTRLHSYDNGGPLAFEWIEPKGLGVLMSVELSQTVFNKLFIRHQTNAQYFKEIALNTPDYQLWRVGGDRR